jgi:GT2 family glycosyltransferase
MIKVSLIIPSFERAGVLMSLLEHIHAHPFHGIGHDEIELLIIDQSPGPDEALQDIVLPYPTRYYHLKEPGLPNARNIGLCAAQGDICIFIDDDVEIDADFVEAHWRQYEDHSVGAVAGRVLEYGNRMRVAGETPANMYGINLLGRPHPNTGGTTDRDVQSFRGCNFSVRRSLIHSVGIFDTRFRSPFLLEESDYAYRIRKAGLRIRFSSDATAVHLDHRSGGCRMEDAVRYQSARFHNAVLFFLKNMSPAALPVFLPASIAIGVTKVLRHPPVVSTGQQLLAGMLEGFASFRRSTPASLEEYLHNQPSPVWKSSAAKNNKVH